jgi:hypothetical protein
MASAENNVPASSTTRCAMAPSVYPTCKAHAPPDVTRADAPPAPGHSAWQDDISDNHAQAFSEGGGELQRLLRIGRFMESVAKPVSVRLTIRRDSILVVRQNSGE